MYDLLYFKLVGAPLLSYSVRLQKIDGGAFERYPAGAM